MRSHFSSSFQARQLGAQPCQPGGGIKVPHTPPPRPRLCVTEEGGDEGWTSSRNRAVQGRDGPSLSNGKLTRHQKETNSLYLVPPLGYFLPQTGNRKGSLRRRRATASPHFLPHTSLFLAPPSSLVLPHLPPSIAGFLFFIFSAIFPLLSEKGNVAVED